MERIIIFGRVYCFDSKKSGKTCYCLDYLDAQTGKSYTDYFVTYQEYLDVKNQNIPLDTTCVGLLKLNEFDKPYVSSISIN